MSGPPPTSTLLEVIILVFAKSELRELVGTDALRSVLEGQMRSLFPEPDTMELQPVYELLETQPGFDPEKAIAPFCRLKTWEAALRVKVMMPVALEHLDARTRDMKAMNVNAFDSDLDKLLRPTVKTPALTKVIEATPQQSAAHASSNRVKFALIAAAIGLIAAGVSAYLTLSGGEGNSRKLAASELSEKVPIAHVRQSGDIIVATLTDEKWLEKPEFERRKELEEMVIKMAGHQARTMLLVDKKGMTLGTIVMRGLPIIVFAQPVK